MSTFGWVWQKVGFFSIICKPSPLLTPGSASDEDIYEFFTSRGCTAATDFPSALFYKRLVQVFPHAKVILTTRNHKTWQRSMKESLYLAYCNRTQLPWRWSLFALDWRFLQGLDELYDLMDGVWLEAVLGEEKLAAEFCSDWEREVLASVEEQKLLVFQASDGWEPLCSFLNKPVPTTQYPRLNNALQFQEGYTRFRLLTCLLWGVAFIVLLAVINSFLY